MAEAYFYQKMWPLAAFSKVLLHTCHRTTVTVRAACLSQVAPSPVGPKDRTQLIRLTPAISPVPPAPTLLQPPSCRVWPSLLPTYLAFGHSCSSIFKSPPEKTKPNSIFRSDPQHMLSRASYDIIHLYNGRSAQFLYKTLV